MGSTTVHRKTYRKLYMSNTAADYGLPRAATEMVLLYLADGRIRTSDRINQHFGWSYSKGRTELKHLGEAGLIAIARWEHGQRAWQITVDGKTLADMITTERTTDTVTPRPWINSTMNGNGTAPPTDHETELELSLPAKRVLLQLADGPRTTGWLGRRLNYSAPSTVSRAGQLLQHKGLAEVIGKDVHQLRYALTPKGKALAQALIEQRHRLFGALPEPEPEVEPEVEAEVEPEPEMDVEVTERPPVRRPEAEVEPEAEVPAQGWVPDLPAAVGRFEMEDQVWEWVNRVTRIDLAGMARGQLTVIWDAIQ